ncbi:Aste57867_2147 [Aphanomyces stellatus]|uniref:Aste57867_2147 protein n=1 Tax=Aphanomyces stellatus TaxID=120398 RepID=A0A485KC21_9STRA|nr:hypothetical protein As57867_002142 [Aphanomyces stellatus]VFT79350.1 Aste57867_2147 [Aphanomyces stellatus]
MTSDAKRAYECERKRRYRAKIRATRDLFVPSPAPMSCEDTHVAAAAARQYECERKRRYRADQRRQIELYQDQIVQLQEELSRRLSISQSSLPRTQSNLSLDDSSSLVTNRTLRMQVQRHADLLRRLQSWVYSAFQPPPSLTSALCGPSSPWLHSTLLADPMARRHGMLWLTDRVFHSAVAQHALDIHVEDILQLELLHDDSALWGMSTQTQSTYLASLDDVAHALWCVYNGPAAARETLNATTGDAHVTYTRIQNTRLGTHLMVLRRRYNLSRRVVLVHVYLRDDDCVPRTPQEIRPHGFGWCIAEKIASDITLVRHRTVQYAPETTAGPISLDRIAAMYGVAQAPTPPATLARIEHHACQEFTARHALFSKQLFEQIETNEKENELR